MSPTRGDKDKAFLSLERWEVLVINDHGLPRLCSGRARGAITVTTTATTSTGSPTGSSTATTAAVATVATGLLARGSSVAALDINVLLGGGTLGLGSRFDLLALVLGLGVRLLDCAAAKRERE